MTVEHNTRLSLRNNPAYTLGIEVDKYRVYIPSQETEYSAVRKIDASAQVVASEGLKEDGEVIKDHVQAILDRCTAAASFDGFKTDITTLAQTLMNRIKYPGSQQIHVRIGCALSFLEYEDGEDVISEDPAKCDFIFQQRKEVLAYEHPELYTFLLVLGAEYAKRILSAPKETEGQEKAA